MDSLQFGGIFLIGIFQLLESACRIDKVARIDAYTFTHRGRGQCRLRVEVDVGNEWDVAALGT